MINSNKTTCPGIR